MPGKQWYLALGFSLLAASSVQAEVIKGFMGVLGAEMG
jgi:hypothetical protein